MQINSGFFTSLKLGQIILPFGLVILGSDAFINDIAYSSVVIRVCFVNKLHQ